MAKLRLPLQIGSTALDDAVRASLGGWGALLLGGLALGLASGGMGGLLPSLPSTIAFLVVGSAAIVLGTTADGWRRRGRTAAPSDLLIDDEGLVVEGGPRGGIILPWAQVDAAGTRVATDPYGRRSIARWALSLVGAAKTQHVPVTRLLVGEPGDNSVVIAEAERPSEIASLEDLATTIAEIARGHAPSSAPAAAASGPRLLACPNCAAVQPLVDADTITCRACGTKVPVPTELRDRLRASLALPSHGAAAERLVRRALAQPHAAVATRGLAVVRWLLLLVWPVAAALFFAIVVLQEAEPGAEHPIVVRAEDAPVSYSAAALLGIAVAVAVTFAAHAALSTLLARRRALRLLALRFGAVAPTRPGEPHGCRQCGALLAEPPGRLVVRCPYCDADNVLALDVRREARAATEAERSVAGALSHQRWAFAARLAVATVAAAFAALALYQLDAALHVPRRGTINQYMYTRATVENRAPWPRWLRVTDGTKTVRAIAPAHETVSIECATACQLQSGPSTVTAAQDQATAYILDATTLHPR